MTMMTLRKMEKNTAFFDFPSPTNTAWPANWRDIMKNPKKYTRMAGTPASTSSPSLLKMRMKNSGHSCTKSQTTTVYAMLTADMNTMDFLTRLYSLAP